MDLEKHYGAVLKVKRQSPKRTCRTDWSLSTHFEINNSLYRKTPERFGRTSEFHRQNFSTKMGAFKDNLKTSDRVAVEILPDLDMTFKLSAFIQKEL